MIELKVLNTQGKEVGKMEAPEAVFGAEYNEALIHQVVVAQLANKRQGTKSTLTRTEVRGGGIKPWRQKGTGRARQGSIRAPQWVKGGVVFAPKPRDFSKKINAKMKKAALASALSKKLADGEVVILDSFRIAEPKTKLVQGILNNLSVKSTALLVLPEHNADAVRAGRNIQELTMSEVNLMNVYDVVKAGVCILTKDAVNTLAEVYAE